MKQRSRRITVDQNSQIRSSHTRLIQVSLKTLKWKATLEETPITDKSLSIQSKATPTTMRKLKNKPGGHTCSHKTRKQQKGRRQYKKLSVSIARSNQSKKMPPKIAMSQSQESLRWVGVLDDLVEEEKRIEIYKANRRKRYLAAQEDLMKSLACIDNQ